MSKDVERIGYREALVDAWKVLRQSIDDVLPQHVKREFLARQDFASLTLLQKIMAVPHIATATLMILYYASAKEAASSEPKIASLDSVDAAVEDALLARSVEEAEANRSDLQRFLQASKSLNTLYVLLPAIFVLYLVALDKLAKYSMATSCLREFWNNAYGNVAKNFSDPRWIRDFTLDFRPLVLSWCILIPPATLILMPVFATKTFLEYVFPKKTTLSGLEQRCGQPCLVIAQERDRQLRRGSFYSSGWFNPIMAIPFILGVPASISVAMYFNLGIDAQLSYPSEDPSFKTVFMVIQLYLYGLGSCLCALFFRSYFSFYWNFYSCEYELEVYPDMIKRLPIKGWFLDFMTLSGRLMPFEMKWSDVKEVKFSSNRYKPNNANVENPVVAFFGKLTTVYESLAQKLEMNSDNLHIVDTRGREIAVRLWELSHLQKVELFQALRLYCPSIHLDESVQRALVGSTVMREPRYTQIWFSVLTDKNEINVDGDLKAQHELQSGRFKVCSKIASGGQAVIYEATDTSTGQSVVLKEFRLTNGESLDARIESAKDFENESALLSQLNHKSIVKMLGMFYENGRVYIALEHVEGKSLRDIVIESGTMSTPSILNLAEQMCDILEYLHGLEPPVVHRDFTPDNLILQSDGSLKLIDFSIAQRKAKNNDCAGKHAYTPPEQFGGRAVPQSDLYALGGTLYFLATGEDPEALTQLELSEGDGEAGELLSKVIQNCTSLQLSERFESAKWILNELGSIDRSESSTETDTQDEEGAVLSTEGMRQEEDVLVSSE